MTELSPADLLRSIRRSNSDGDDRAWEALAALAASMAVEGRERSDPIREVMGLLGDRWTMLILLALDAGAWRHATLRRIIGALAIEGAISQRMLTLKLRTLERNGIVIRTVTADVPPRVSYRLSDMGSSLLAQARQILDWVRVNRPGIDSARAQFDHAVGD